MSQRDEITRIPLTIVSTLDGARTDDVLVGVLAADLDALERRAAGLLVPPDAVDQQSDSLLLALYVPTIDGVEAEADAVADELVAIINEERKRNGGTFAPVIVDLFPAPQWVTADTLNAFREFIARRRADFLDTQETPQ